jgi:TRAP-type uncharacterized transport system substrate-binding protein
VDRGITEDMSELLADGANVSIQFTDGPLSEDAALNAVASGDADIALVSNNLPFRSDIATVMPLYPTVLHIGRLEGGNEPFELEMLRNATIYAGPEGSASRHVFERIATRMDIGNDEYRYANILEEAPDAVIVFSPISPERVKEVQELLREYPDFQLSSMGKADDVGKGTFIDAALLLNPSFRSFVIPLGTYGEMTKEAILTVAVDKMLVARRDLDSAIVYDLINAILRLRPALAARRPGLFQHLTDDFDVGRSTYIVHAGTQAYLQRDAPSVYERYSGIAEVVVTVVVALGSALFAMVRIFRMRRKNLIDTFYTQTIALQRSVNESSTPAERSGNALSVRCGNSSPKPSTSWWTRSYPPMRASASSSPYRTTCCGSSRTRPSLSAPRTLSHPAAAGSHRAPN